MKIAYGVTRVKEHWLRHPIYYHEGCCPPDTVAAMQESEADHPEHIRKKLHFLINPDETVKQQNVAMSVFLNSMQHALSSVRYALTVYYGGKQEDYIKWKLLKTVAYALPTSKKELVKAGIDRPIAKKHGNKILTYIANSIKGEEEDVTREDPALVAYLISLEQPVGSAMVAQVDARLRDERSTKRRKTDDVTQPDQNNKSDTSTREDPKLAYLIGLEQPVGSPMAAQADARLRDERSTKRRKTDDATQLDQNNEGDTSTPEDLELAYLISLEEPGGSPMAAQADTRLRDERSTKIKKTDDATARKTMPKGQADVKCHCQGIPAVVVFSRSTLY
jgi:hypothetical protein